jgi:hypothetical protein
MTLSLFTEPSARPRYPHKRAKADRTCDLCGALTNSHPLAGRVLKPATCRDCGLPVSVLVPAARCHKCWLEHGPPAAPPPIEEQLAEALKTPDAPG